jgi:hypothetical protein
MPTGKVAPLLKSKDIAVLASINYATGRKRSSKTSARPGSYITPTPKEVLRTHRHLPGL